MKHRIAELERLLAAAKIEGLEQAVSVLRGCEDSGRTACLEIEHIIREEQRYTETRRFVADNGDRA